MTFTGSPPTVNPLEAGAPIIASVLGGLLLLVIALLCIFKRRRAKRRAAAADVRDEDENPTYGDYFDPDPIVEVEDSNAYYSSDYEAGSGTSKITDNNPDYVYE